MSTRTGLLLAEYPHFTNWPRYCDSNVRRAFQKLRWRISEELGWSSYRKASWRPTTERCNYEYDTCLHMSEGYIKAMYLSTWCEACIWQYFVHHSPQIISTTKCVRSTAHSYSCCQPCHFSVSQPQIRRWPTLLYRPARFVTIVARQLEQNQSFSQRRTFAVISSSNTLLGTHTRSTSHT